MAEDYNNIFSEIKSKVSLPFEMEKHGCTLSKAGINKLRCVCPFHADSDPSLIVYLENEDGYESFHCFGCRASGDVINFIKLFLGVNTTGALKYFSENYALEFSKNIDISRLIDLSFSKEKNINYLESHIFKVSDPVRRFLSESKNVIQDLNYLKPYLKGIDNSVFENDYFLFEYYREMLIKAIKDMREKKETE
jgi:hypothetical protein